MVQLIRYRRNWFVCLLYSFDSCADNSDKGESRHSRLKDQNDRTNYNNATPQIIGIDIREAVHARMMLRAGCGSGAGRVGNVGGETRQRGRGFNL